MDIQEILTQVNDIMVIDKLNRKKEFEKGQCFNVFNVLNLRTQEVRLHSAFLAELLNPNGSHGKGAELLRRFLEEVGIDRNFIQECRGQIVERSIGEKTDTTGGRIDIILEDGKHAVIIENKIYAGDQENQLLRYYNYGKQFEDCKLLYLTLDGHPASTTSTGGQAVPYSCISYHTHIINWLERCLACLWHGASAYGVIEQYINLLKELTHQNMNDATLEMLRQFIESKFAEKPTEGQMIKHMNELISDIETVKQGTIRLHDILQEEFVIGCIDQMERDFPQDRVYDHRPKNQGHEAGIHLFYKSIDMWVHLNGWNFGEHDKPRYGVWIEGLQQPEESIEMLNREIFADSNIGLMKRNGSNNAGLFIASTYDEVYGKWKELVHVIKQKIEEL